MRVLREQTQGRSFSASGEFDGAVWVLVQPLHRLPLRADPDLPEQPFAERRC